MLLTHDVVHLMRSVRIALIEAAVFAATAGSFCDGAALSGPSPPAVTAAASFGHDHKVFELQEVFELSSFFGTQSIAFGQSDQVRNACQRFFRGTERVYLLG